MALTAMGSQTRLSAMPDQHRVMHGHGLDRETVLSNLYAVENIRLGEISHGPVARMFMKKPPLHPDVADAAPTDAMLTPYDHERRRRHAGPTTPGEAFIISCARDCHPEGRDLLAR
jgi:hypothetical protein